MLQAALVISAGAPVLDPSTTTITVSNAAALAPSGPANFVIRVDQEQMLVTSVNLSAGTLTVTRGFNGTTAVAHASGADVFLENPPPAPPSNFEINLTQAASSQSGGTEFEATLSILNGATLGQVNFTMPPEVANLEIEGGPGNNLLQVNSSVNQNLSLYGGPGNNTLIAGSGNDTLVAGSGKSVLYGGPGADVLYGGDLPQQDATPVLDPSESWSAQIGNTTTNSTTITGLISTTGLVQNQIMSGSGIPAGSVISTIVSSTSITISNPATQTASDVTIAFGSSTPEGRDTLIAGNGNSELFAGSGGDVLIGGSATLENGQFVLEPGAGRDLLAGGSGNDLLIAGLGSPGSVLMAGSGNDILVGENSGSNIMVSDVGGNDLFLGYAGSNDIDASGSSGNDTLVGGNGFNSLFGSDGTDQIYDYPYQPSWNQAVQQAAAMFSVQLITPFGTGGGATPQDQLWSLLDALETQPLSFTSAQQASLSTLLAQQLVALGVTDTTGSQLEAQLYTLQTQSPYPGNIQQLVAWLDEDPTVHSDLQQILLTILDSSSSGLSQSDQFLWRNLLADELNQDAAQESQVAQQIVSLAAVNFIAGSEAAAQFTSLASESYSVSSDELLVSKLLGATNADDSLHAGNGVDFLYGNPSLPTWMAGGAGKDTFYNFHSFDTLYGGSGDDNTVFFQGDGTFNLNSDSSNPNAIGVVLTTQQSALVNGSAISQLATTAGLFLGEPVSGGGIPAGATILSINSATNTIVLSQPAMSSGTETITFTTNSWQAGGISTAYETMSNIQVLGVQTGNANDDAVDINVQFLPSGFTGIYVQAGNGNGDVIDAHPLAGSVDDEAPATLLGGTGADTIIVGTELGAGSVYQGNSASELDVVGTQPGGDTVSVSGGLIRIDGLPINSQTGNTSNNSPIITGLTNAMLLSPGQSVSGVGIPANTTVLSNLSPNAITISNPVQNSPLPNAYGVQLTFGITFKTLKVLGISGTVAQHVTNTFSSDGSIPNIVLEGGSGQYTTNILTASGGTDELIGGNQADNVFNTIGAGAYTINGGGPAASASAPQSSPVTAPPPSAISPATDAPFPLGAYNMAATTAGTVAVFAGGNTASGAATNYVETYNPSQPSGQQWGYNTNLPYAAYGLAAASADGMAVFVGGSHVGFADNPYAEIFNTTTQQWTLTPIDDAGVEMAATTVGNEALFAGGQFTNFTCSDTVEIFNPTAPPGSQWTYATLPVSQGLYGMTATSVGQYALFAGGVNPNSGYYNSTVAIYNTVTGAWTTTTLPDHQGGYYGMASTSVGPTAFFAGGISNAGTANTVDMYNVITGQWSTTTLPGSQGFFSMRAATIGSDAIFAGGSYPTGAANYNVFIYDTNTQTWTTQTTSQGQTVAITADGSQLVFGGGTASTGGVSIYSSVINLAPLVTNIAVAPAAGSTPTDTLESITYALVDSAAGACNVAVEYSINGGPWFSATEATGAAGDQGTMHLASSASGVTHTFLWNTGTDLPGSNNPSVQIRFTPGEASSTGDTESSASFAVNNSGVTNALNISWNDIDNDSIQLTQSGSTITLAGTIAGSSLSGTATNMTSVSVDGGTGNNLLDATATVMGVTLDGGSGGGDTLYGGAGSDTFDYSGPDSIYQGATGMNNELIFPDTAASLGSVSNIESVVLSGDPPVATTRLAAGLAARLAGDDHQRDGNRPGRFVPDHEPDRNVHRFKRGHHL